MSITQNESELLEWCASLPKHEQTAVNDSCEAVFDILRAAGVEPATDDRAARLEAAIVRYVIESQS